MNKQLTIDQAGRIVIPKPLRDDLSLQTGDALELSVAGDTITLRPVRQAPGIRRKRGFWVVNSGRQMPPGLVEETIARIREERDTMNWKDRK